MMPAPLILASGRFSLFDWSIVAAYLLATTRIGARLAGKQSNIRDFFLAGRRLPWWAICGSIIATEVSTATFVGVPTISFAAGGNFTYLQLALGAILARVLIAVYFIPQYYQHEIYSPYDYMGARLGPPVKEVTTVLFMIGAVLGHGARIFICAFVVGYITGFSLVTSIWIIGLFSVVWTWIGGMASVIWTDVAQFVILVGGALLCLFYTLAAVSEPLPEAWRIAAQAGKLQILDASLDLSQRYTLWVGLLAMPFLNLAAFGVDQTMAQRLFCCRNRRDAQKAILVSSVSQLLPLMLLVVGVALFLFYRNHPMTPEDQARHQEYSSFLLPIFIVRELPVGIRGLIVAAILAAAAPASTLAALAQSSIGALETHLGRGRAFHFLQTTFRGEIARSRGLVVFWGIVLCGMATICIPLSRSYGNVIDLALALVGYTYGALLGIFLLAFMPRNRSAAGLPWAVAMTILAVFGLNVHVKPGAADWADWVVWIGAGTLLLGALFYARGNLAKTAVSVAVCLLIVALHHASVGTVDGRPRYPEWGWAFPVGTFITFFMGRLLGHPEKKQRPAG